MVLRHKIKAFKEASSCLNSIGNPLTWLSLLRICPATPPYTLVMMVTSQLLVGYGSKGLGSSFQEEALYTYTLRLDKNRISILYKKRKKEFVPPQMTGLP